MIKAKKSNEQLVFSAMLRQNEILLKSTKSRNGATWKLPGMFYEGKPQKFRRTFWDVEQVLITQHQPLRSQEKYHIIVHSSKDI